MPFPVCCEVITQPFIESCSDLISKKLFKDFINDGLHTYWTIIFHVQLVLIHLSSNSLANGSSRYNGYKDHIKVQRGQLSPF